MCNSINSTPVLSTNFSLPTENSPRSLTPTPILPSTDVVANPNWSTRTITRLNEWENRLDHLLPNFTVQDRIDQLGRAIEKQFAPLEKFNQWLDKKGEGSWYQRLASFLYKLPLKAVRNVVRLLYRIIKNALYAVVHPMKAALELAKNLVHLINALTKPETWSVIGASMIGVGFGHALGSGNPLSVIGLGIGAAMLLGGMTIGTLKEALSAETGKKMEAVKTYLMNQCEALPETMLTGLLLGLLMGAIQRGLKERALQQVHHQADQFVKDHQLPQYSKLHVNDSGDIILRWDGLEKYQIQKINPLLTHKSHLDTSFYQHSQQQLNFAELNMSSGAKELTFNFKSFGIWKWGQTQVNFDRVISLEDFINKNWQAFRDVVVENANSAVYS